MSPSALFRSFIRKSLYNAKYSRDQELSRVDFVDSSIERMKNSFLATANGRTYAPTLLNLSWIVVTNPMH